MRLHRFYVKTPISEDKFDISDRDLVHQWRSVFRYNVGSQVILFDGSGIDYLALITSLRNTGATMEIIEKKFRKNLNNARNLFLCVGLIKKDNFELVVQKTTELGAKHIIPVLCERSEKKNLNMKRLEKIAIEASEQSGRGDIPIISEIVELSYLLKNNTLPKEKFFLHMDGQYIGDTLQNKNSKDLAVFIGPEGGFSDKEIQDFAFHNTPSVSLGTQTLRAETTAIAVTSLLLL
ncbi:MAG: RsmE family RNA methyltransferase [Minisyncoccia bacterium]